MKVSERGVLAIAEVVMGNKNLAPYRRGWELVKLFNEYGFDDVYDERTFPVRAVYTTDKVKALNGTPELTRLICEVLHPIAFLDAAEDQQGACDYLNARLRFDDYEIVLDSSQVPQIRSLKGSLVEFAHPGLSSGTDDRGFLNEQLEKCNTKLREGDYDGAVTNARSLTEEVLTALELRLDASAPDYDGDLLKLFKRVQRLLNLEPGRPDVDTALKQVLTGLASIVAGLGGLSNKMGDRHARKYKPEQRHAVLVVDSAKTLTNFLISTYERQQSKS